MKIFFYNILLLISLAAAGYNVAHSQNDTLSAEEAVTSTFYGEVRIAEGGPDDVVHYMAEDSHWLDNTNRIFHLYGNAQIKYQDLALDANYIYLDLARNTAHAVPYPNEDGELVGFPVFREGNQVYHAQRIEYNFVTRKGMVEGAFTQQGDLNIHGRRTKIIGQDESEDASDFVIYQQDALFTTCDHPEPHFGIRSSRQKVIPGELAVIGPSNLEIAGVPTPLWLPFGFFPLIEGGRAGIIFPRDFEFSPRWGYGISNIGYYVPINEYIDVELNGNIYLRGSWALGANVRYNRRYKYNGNVNINYSVFREEAENSTDINRSRSFSIRINHNQDQRAHPTRNFGGNIHIETNEFRSLNFNDYDNVFNNQLSSNFSFSQIFPGRPFRVNASLSHRQNTQSGQMDITFPNVNFQMNQIFPFKNRQRTGPEQWYEKISFRYNASYQNRFSAPDSLFLSPEFFESSRMGFRHNASSNAVFRVARHFNLTPSVEYNETWYVQTLERQFQEDLDIRVDTIYNQDSTEFFIQRDTISFGEVVDLDRRGLDGFRTYRASLNLNTQIFGTARFRSGFLRGVRHTMKPNIGLSYAPDFTRESLGYFEELPIINQAGKRDTIRYSRFQDGIFGGPPTGGSQMLMNYSIGNTLEAKVFNRKDSTERNISLLNNVNVSGSYDFNRDSLNWSMVNVRGTSRLFGGISTLTLGLMYDPYALDDEGRRIDKFYMSETGRPLRFVQANVRISSRMSINQLLEILPFGPDPDSEGSSVLDLIRQLTINHQIGFVNNAQFEEGWEINTHFISFRGSIPLSEKWNLNFTNIDYNFQQGRISYPDFGISRDLHCWTMALNWQPRRGTYQFTISVKPGSMDFLNVPYRKSRVDGFSGF
ncbi:MAG: hypothetical protein EA411_10090 [Saprospirales bacterium]|nr:MAG: hypothetical protein EA411_10090 [Saprospirales bacterium]